ncbi:o-succinylbenzoate synthase [Flavobacterium sp. CS20]|uniref:o-succinylbenzoate synthase n=1 Tax=Flavobacterium sp. CS20 TaxID=2775246 RepID=UPI001B3A206F|nr:o-succinylbenzoate synthase [Flavobacterium sp. CS20]QTY26161.1 o-succinylbenzoate synthase [Flavobacterium sp. CS20]
MREAYFKPYNLIFKQASGTSRGVLREKKTYFLILEDGQNKGIGECGLFKGLSFDDRPDYENQLQWVCEHIDLGLDELLKKTIDFPSIQFGLEMAFLSLEADDGFDLFPSKFTQGQDKIPINGLIWMGEKSFMKSQIEDKIKQGFHCVKLKIGAIDFEEELNLLKYIRQEFSAKDIELRVDANGAFEPHQALEKLKRLSEYELHSIEQPIKQGHWEVMAKLCEKTPLDIALDEELIGIQDVTKRQNLLQTIQPQYIILKPSLVGGFEHCKTWMKIADQHQIGYWITSALESNVGLNAIAQFTYSLSIKRPQGLGTGSLFTNNIKSPLEVKGEYLTYNPNKKWDNFNEIITV